MRKTFLSIIFLLILLLVPTMVFATGTASLPDAVDGVITLTEDIVLEDTVVIDSTVTLDLNGHTLSNTTDIWNTTTASYALISVGEGGNLTIIGEGTLQAKENDCFAVMVKDGGKLTINSGKYVGNISSVYIISEGEVVINGGEYSIQQLSPEVETDKYRYTLNCYDEYYTAGTAKFIVTGGKFHNFNPENNLSEGKGTNYLAEGYEVTQTGDYYVVSKIHTHSYNSEWKCDDTNHWHECSCGEKVDVAQHQTELRNVVEASITTAGYSGDRVCKICNKLIESGKTIPALVIVENETAKVESDVLDQAINEATNKDIVELDLTKVGETVTSVEISSMSIEAVKQSNKPLEVKVANATVIFDTKALEEVARNVKNAETVTLKVEKANEETLNKEQKEAIKDKKLEMVISVELLTGDETLSDFKGGKVNVKIPFTPENGAKGEDYKIIYIADDGSIQEIDTKYIDGNLVVELEHFSDYAVIKVAEKDETPKMGTINTLYIWVTLAVIAIVGIATTKKVSKHSK